MRVRYAPAARTELDEVFLYINERNPEAAQGVKLFIQKVIEGIGTFPYLGRESDRLSGLRVLPLGRFDYMIFYLVRDKEIIIVHVRHTKRQSWK